MAQLKLDIDKPVCRGYIQYLNIRKYLKTHSYHPSGLRSEFEGVRDITERGLPVVLIPHYDDDARLTGELEIWVDNSQD